MYFTIAFDPVSAAGAFLHVLFANSALAFLAFELDGV